MGNIYRAISRMVKSFSLPLTLVWRLMQAAKEHNMTETEVVIVALERLLEENYGDISEEGQAWINARMAENRAKRDAATEEVPK